MDILSPIMSQRTQKNSAFMNYVLGFIPKFMISSKYRYLHDPILLLYVLHDFDILYDLLFYQLIFCLVLQYFHMT